MAERTVKVVLQASVDQYKRDMAAAGKATDAAAKSGTKGFRDQSTVMDRAAASAAVYDQRMLAIKRTSTIAGAAILGGLAIGLVKSTHAASDLNETINKSNVIFGSSSAQMQEWGDNAAKSLGLSKKEALESAASFGDMFAQLGWGQQEAANMSQSVVKLAADLGSFNNLPTAEVSQMIAAGFRGEYDSLQRLIPNINAARVQTEALAMTGKSNAASLTAQEKAAATLAIIQKDGARAQDDFARTSGEAANAQKIAAAEFENAQAKLGENLTPALAAAANAASTLLSAFNALPGPVRTAAIVITAAAGAYLFLGPKIAAARAALIGKTAATVADTAATTANAAANRAAGASAAASGARFSSAASGLTSWPLLLGAAGTAASKWAADSSNATDELNNLQRAGVGLMAAMNPLLHLGMGGTFFGGTSSEITDVGEAMRNAGVSADELQAALDGDAAAIELVKSKLSAVPAPASETAKAIDSVAAAADAANGDVDEFAKKLEALIAPGMAASKAADASTEAIRKVSEAARENGSALTGNSTAALANREAIRSAIQANLDLAVARARATGNEKEAVAVYDRQTRALVDAGVKAGLSRRQLEGFVASMKATSGLTAKPQVQPPELAPLQSALAKAQARLNSLKQSKVPNVRAIDRAAATVRDIQGKIDRIQQRRKPPVDVNNQPALSGIGAVVGALDRLNGKRATTYVYTEHRTGITASAGHTAKRASGGHVRGPGSATSDSIPAMLSNGEYVIQAAAVSRYGVGFFDRLNAMRFARGGVVRYTNQKAYDRAKQLYDDRVRARNDAFAARNNRAQETRTSFLSSAFGTFDFGAYEQRKSDTASAIRDEVDALKALTDARRAALRAKGADKPAAIREAAEAQRRYAEATQARADAEKAEAAAKPTAANIIKAAQGEITRMTTFAQDLTLLKNWGVPSFLISDMLRKPEGPEMARALVTGGRAVLQPLTSAAGFANMAAATLANIDVAVSTISPGGATFAQDAANKQKAIPKRRPVLVKKRAMGGPVSSGSPYLVGEDGPELFWPGASGQIVSNGVMHSTAGASPARAVTANLRLEMPGVGPIWQGILRYADDKGFELVRR